MVFSWIITIFYCLDFCYLLFETDKNVFSILYITTYSFIRSFGCYLFHSRNSCLGFPCASALYLVFGFLRLSGRELDEKLVLSLILLVNVAVGIPANIYVFLKSTNWLWKIFSLSIIILIVVPLLTGLIAHSIGKRNLSKKLVQTFYLKKRIRDMPE